MESTIIFILLFFIILGIIGLGYVVYDYLKYKQNLQKSFIESTDTLNYNFGKSSNIFSKMYGDISSNEKLLNTVSSNLVVLDSYSKNSSNILSQQVITNTNIINTSLNRFDSNLNKYFSFSYNVNNSSNSINDKIYNYIFGNQTPNLDLISKTTAVSGLTIKSDLTKELRVCSSDLSKCVKMSTDINGNFTISPDGTSNILFKNNTGSSIANIDTYRSAIYLGGDTSNNSAMYIQNNDVYVKNLKLINNDLTQNLLMNYESIKMPLTTFYTIQLDNNGESSYITTITIYVFFVNGYLLTAGYRNLKMNITNINIDDLNNLSLSEVNDDSTTLVTEPYIILKLKNQTDTLQQSLSTNINYIGNLTINFNTISEIPAGYILEVKIKVNSNITSFNTARVFNSTTQSYFMT